MTEAAETVRPTEADAPDLLRRVFRHGLLQGGRGVVGHWRVVAVDPEGTSSRVTVVAVSRTEGGRMSAVTLEAMAGDDLARLAAERVAVAPPSPEAHATLVETLLWLDAHARWDGTDRQQTEVAHRVVHLADVIDGGRSPRMGDRTRRRACLDDLAASREGAAAFVSTLDPRAVAVLRHFRAPWHDDALGRGYHAIDRTFDPAAPLAHMLIAHRHLTCSVLAAWQADPLRCARDVADGIPEAPLTRLWTSGGLAPALAPLVLEMEADLVATPPDPMDPYDPLRSYDRDGCVTLVGRLSDLPRNWVPRDPVGRRALRSCAPLVDQAWQMAGRERRADGAMAALVAAGRGWPDLARRVDALHGDGRLAEAFQDVEDMAVAFTSQVLLPADALSRGRTEAWPRLDPDRNAGAAWQILFSGRSLTSVLGASARWHRGAPALNSAVAGMGVLHGLPGWPAHLPDHATGGLSLHVLTTVRELIDEGADGTDADGARGLAHCVGGYGDACRAGRARVASIRRLGPDGTASRLSTVEFSWERGKVGVEQHRGRANAVPCPEAVALVEGYVDGLGERPWWPPVEGAHDLSGIAGYDWRVPGAWEAVRDLWRPHVPRAVRDLGAAALGRAACRVWEGEDPGGTWLTREGLAALLDADAQRAPVPT